MRTKITTMKVPVLIEQDIAAEIFPDFPDFPRLSPTAAD
jgi:hypothetical protein